MLRISRASPKIEPQIVHPQPPSVEEKRAEFDKMLSVYQCMLNLQDGRGCEGQREVDAAYKTLMSFTKTNPEFAAEFAKRIPHKFQVYDDGCGGKQQAVYDLLRRRLTFQ